MNVEEVKQEVAASKLQAELERVSMDKDQQIAILKEELQEMQMKLAAHREESTEQQELIMMQQKGK